jgi:hypothetical protein
MSLSNTFILLLEISNHSKFLLFVNASFEIVIILLALILKRVRLGKALKSSSLILPKLLADK